MNEEPEEDTLQAARNGYELFGEPLRDYSYSRRSAAQTMGLLFPNIGEAGAAQYERSGTYPGMLNDVLIVLWLCTLPDHAELTREQIATEWTPRKANKRVEDALETAIEWAGGKGLVSLDMSNEKVNEAIQVWMAIVQNVEASKFTLQTADNPAGGDDSGNV